MNDRRDIPGQRGGPDEPEESPELARLRAEIDQVEKAVARRIDPGFGAVVIAVAVLVFLVAAVLPWVGPASGLQILLGQRPAGAAVGPLPTVFAFAAVLIGVLASAIGLMVRRWGMAWICALGCFATTIVGVLSIWTQQTTQSHEPGPGPGGGLVLAVLAVLVLAVQWLRIAWSRPATSPTAGMEQ
ncbi:Rv2732c family membrane protein [Goodfellowiella coeruleoviolacea]|uniref:Transmembrane protein n=1 Tax=Goodfellowiella coeruleoviolacea TaxID=334858 RepID=A0AAE3KPV8_9PSEU|nr:hypothetical protein [Goodfellowiella coeruleoviolacea]MCP2170288.1 hypothetical protein [Goodfellowiella coeruleoviolacea]